MTTALTRQKITPCLWFGGNAVEAARFYVSLFPGSSIDKVHHAAADSPGGKAGEELFVDFTLAGQRYQGLNGRGPKHAPSYAMSLSVLCEDQAEVDRLWAGLTGDGGKEIACGWVEDKYGFAWQIVPRRLTELMNDPDRARAKRAMEAMMKMVKLDVASLERAAAGG